MSAQRLRDAAKVLRERAEAATPGPWEAIPDDPYDWPILGNGGYLCHSPDDGVRGGHDEGDATYIATMHPGVALALADWLDDVAGLRAGRGDLAVADLILGAE